MILGAAWIKNSGAKTGGRPSQEKLEELVRALRSNSSEMGTRVVRHIVRDLDGGEEGEGRKYETLLGFLSCFNRPIAKSVFEASLACCIKFLQDADPEHRSS